MHNLILLPADRKIRELDYCATTSRSTHTVPTHVYRRVRDRVPLLLLLLLLSEFHSRSAFVFVHTFSVHTVRACVHVFCRPTGCKRIARIESFSAIHKPDILDRHRIPITYRVYIIIRACVVRPTTVTPRNVYMYMF